MRAFMQYLISLFISQGGGGRGAGGGTRTEQPPPRTYKVAGWFRAHLHLRELDAPGSDSPTM